MIALICDENDRTKSLEHDTSTKCEGRWITTRKIDRAYQAENTLGDSDVSVPHFVAAFSSVFVGVFWVVFPQFFFLLGIPKVQNKKKGAK